MFRKRVGDGTLYHESYFNNRIFNDSQGFMQVGKTSPSLKKVKLLHHGQRREFLLTANSYRNISDKVIKDLYDNFNSFILVTEDTVEELRNIREIKRLDDSESFISFSPIFTGLVPLGKMRIVYESDDGGFSVEEKKIYALADTIEDYKVVFSELFEEAQQLYNKNNGEPISVSDLAKAVGVETSFLERLVLNYNSELIKSGLLPQYSISLRDRTIRVKPLSASEKTLLRLIFNELHELGAHEKAVHLEELLRNVNNNLVEEYKLSVDDLRDLVEEDSVYFNLLGDSVMLTGLCP